VRKRKMDDGFVPGIIIGLFLGLVAMGLMLGSDIRNLEKGVISKGYGSWSLDKELVWKDLKCTEK
jgi:hypothetical protein